MIEVKEDMTGWNMWEHGVLDSRIIVIGRADDAIYPSGQRHAQWVCKCVCGNSEPFVRLGNSIRRGLTKSCGCLQIESGIKNGKATHKTNRYDLTGNYGIGWTSNTDEEFYFDLEDYDKIKDICWNARLDDTNYKSLVGVDTDNGKNVKFSQIVFVSTKGFQCDHIDRNPLNNRKNNLRPATNSENSRNRNRLSSNTSGITGVTFNKKQNRWVARINDNVNHRISVGSFINKEDAIIARLKAEKMYYGEFAPQRHLFEQYNIN